MKISKCFDRPILASCDLQNFNYMIDPYIGCEHYCYYCYVLNKAETDWTKEIFVHRDMANRLSKEISEITPQPIYMGWHADPYQPCERDQRQTRKILELLLERGFSVSILTKSDMFIRDLDLLRKMENASVGISVAFNDDHTRMLFEANTIGTEARINALSRLREVGVKTSAMICPVIPYITDGVPLIEMLSPLTDIIRIYGLSVLDRSDKYWQNTESILNKNYKNLKDQIEAAIFSNEHPYWLQLRKELKELNKEKQYNLEIHL